VSVGVSIGGMGVDAGVKVGVGVKVAWTKESTVGIVM
jgi:hypothetical protein